jgi:3-methylcrotonyl-CoA carboxylase beta subunit
MNEVMEKVRSLKEKIALGGSVKAREKHIARGKMLVREYVSESLSLAMC